MKLVLLFIALCATFSFSAVKESPTDTALKAAEELIETMGLKGQMSAGFDAMMPIIEGQVQQLNLTPEQGKELRAIYKAWFDEDLDHAKMEKAIITSYAQAFTTKELKELKEFYETPLGQKLLEKSPQLMEKGAKTGMDEAMKNQDKLMMRLEPFFLSVK